VDTICPLLTLGGDPRSVSATTDPAHRCVASGALTSIDREHQARFCLGGRYESCDRYLAHVAERGPAGPAWGPAAPDATFSSTRVVLEATARPALPARPRRLGTATLIVVLLVLIGAVVAWAALGGLGGGAAGPSPSSSPSAEATVTARPSASTSPSATATVAPTPTPTPAPTPTAAPTPVTYIVQPGDTLNAIAARYGTTAQAIMQANGLTSDIINVGQVLIIPVP